MPNTLKGTVGEHVPIRVLSRERRSDDEDGRTFPVNGIHVAQITDTNGDALASVPSFTEATSGEYVAHWDTSTLDPGPYLVEVEAGVGFDTVTNTSKTAKKNIVVVLEEAS